jgi:hypothetical protein
MQLAELHGSFASLRMTNLGFPFGRIVFLLQLRSSQALPYLGKLNRQYGVYTDVGKINEVRISVPSGRIYEHTQVVGLDGSTGELCIGAAILGFSESAR